MDVPFLRPSRLATDSSPMIDVVCHTLDYLIREEQFVPDAVLLLQPTAPHRTVAHIRYSLTLLDGFDSVCSVHELPKEYSPHFLMKIRADGCLDYFMADGKLFSRRQDVPAAYKRDGAIYLTRTQVLLKERSFYGSRCCPMLMTSDEVLNIDTQDDWKNAEKRLSMLKPSAEHFGVSKYCNASLLGHDNGAL
jgi:CMP-N,N'-diacetyllegionaminic acid synthase